ncbi:MAG: hypothetical protein KAJ75_00655 [Alphaproteobacteria bacterium]|nr:hypothetical protein [Alphaproteobacteria bacterium]
MSLKSLFSSHSTEPQFVLSLGDENAVLVYCVDGKAKKAWLSSSDYEKSTDNFKEAFEVNPDAPVYLLLDIHEQLYRDEVIPILNIFDKAKVLDRHLYSIFPGNCLHSYMPIETEKNGFFLSSENKTNNYLFIGVPISDLVKGWLGIMDKIHNPFSGTYLLPVESTGLVKKLLPKLKKSKEPCWQVLIGYNIAGGIRQIVLKNGYLIMTRLTQINPELSSSTNCADEIQRNFNATVSYIKRKGYSDNDKLDAVFITSDTIRKHIKDSDTETRTVTIMTPEQVGKRLGLGNISSSEPPFCDMIHAVWFAANSRKKLRFRRNMATGKSLKKTIVQFAPYVLAVLSIVSIMLVSMSFIRIVKIRKSTTNIKQQITKTVEMAQENELLLNRLPYSASKIREIMSLNEKLNVDRQINLVEILSNLEEVLKNEVVISNLSIRAESIKNGSVRRRRSLRKKAGTAIVITINLPNYILTPEKALSFSDEIETQLENVFTDYKVEMIRPPVDVFSNQTLQGRAGVKTERDYTDAEYQTKFKISKDEL